MKGVQDRLSGSQRRWDVVAVLVTVLVAVYYTVGVLWRRAQRGESVPSYDIYAAHYPNILYTLRSLQQGYGLLWNNLQNCGQPFVPSTLLGLFYPPHALFLILDIDTGFLALTALHLAVGGIGAYYLSRQLGLSRVAAACAALTFEVSGPTVYLAGWLPTSILGVYVWIPVAMLLLERIIKEPTAGKGIWLGIVLTLELLPGYPQILVFTYQIVGLRVLWEFATDRMQRPLKMLAVLAIGLALPTLLGAAYLLPSIEFSRESVRAHALSVDEIKIPFMKLTWKSFREDVGRRTTGLGTTFTVVPVALAALALTTWRRRRMAVFYFLVGALYLALPFDNPLFSLYLRLPGGRAFRDPARFIWITNFAFSVLVGMGTDVVVRAGAEVGSRQLRWLAAPLLGVGAFYLLSPLGLYGWEWLCLGGTLVAFTCAILLPRGDGFARLTLPVLLALNLYVVDRHPYLGYLQDSDVIYRNAEAFSVVKDRLTPQERIYQFGKHPDYALMMKSPSVFAVPSIADYEPQTSERFARLYVWLLRNREMADLNMFMYTLTNVPRNKPLFDLLATRYLIRDRAAEPLEPQMLQSLRLLWQQGTVQVYENPTALPRALFVPMIRLVASPDEVLRQLASGTNNPREAALVESLPADGFLGHSAAAGEVTVLQDRAEDLVLHVNATEEGFVFVSDQDYPGWEATVNDIPTPIMRANYVFRLVRVPAGASTVRFRYRPKSLWLGMWVSVLSLVAVVLYGAAAGSMAVRRAQA